MFADPQTLTVNAVAKSLPRVSTQGRTSKYENPTDGLSLDVSHRISSKENSRLVKVTQTKTAADPLDPSVNQSFTMSAHVVIKTPVAGFSANEQLYLVKALKDFLTDANIGKLTSGES